MRAIGAVMRSIAERRLGAATWEEWNASPQRRACFGEHRGAGRLQCRLTLVAYRLLDGLPSLPRWRETGVMVAGMAIGAAWGALPREDLAQRLARSGMHRRSGDAHVSDHRGADRAAGSPVLPACCLLDRRPSPHRREMGTDNGWNGLSALPDGALSRGRFGPATYRGSGMLRRIGRGALWRSSTRRPAAASSAPGGVSSSQASIAVELVRIAADNGWLSV